MDESIVFGNPPSTQTLLFTTHIGSSGRLLSGFRFWMNSHEALEASYSYAPTDLTVNRHCEHVNCGVAWFSSIARSHFFSMNYVHEFRVRNRTRPFLTAGLGLVYFQRIATNGVFEPDPLTVNIGGGVDVRITQHWFLRAEYRDWLLEGPRQCDFDVCGATGLTHNQVPSLGLAFRF